MKDLNVWVDDTQKWIEEIKADLTLKGLNKTKDSYVREIYRKHFFRDPVRNIRRNANYFYSPADGIVLYTKRVNSKDDLVEIKNKNFTIKELLADEDCKGRFIVVGIFMSFYDVHINRMPTDGIITYEDVLPLKTNNFPMLFVEDAIMAKKLNYDINVDYLFDNERRINTIYNANLDLEYNVVQIADMEVDVIMHFQKQEQAFMRQNERFSFVRWGSQCDLVIPIDRRYDFEILAKPNTHVEAGVDKLVKIIKR